MQNNLKRDVVIKSIASLISENHKVDLTNPDKVIIVEIYQVRFQSCTFLLTLTEPPLLWLKLLRKPRSTDVSPDNMRDKRGGRGLGEVEAIQPGRDISTYTETWG
jgi:hypothetical protein